MNPFAASPTSPMRVALIDDVQHQEEGEAWLDEARQRVERLAMGLAKRGHTVDLYRARSAGEPVWEDLCAGVRVHRVADRQAWPLDSQEGLSRAVQAFAAGVRRLAMGVYPCDVVHAWGPLAGLVALRLTRGVAVPFVLTMHEDCVDPDEQDDGGRSLAGVRALLARRADRLIACSDAERDKLIRRHGAMRSSIHVLPCGVDTQALKLRCKAQARRELGLQPDDFIVLWGHPVSGQPSDARACEPYFRALQKLAGHVLVPGGTPAGRPYAMLCAQQGVSSFHIEGCPDHRAMLRACYAAADLVVLPPVPLAALLIEPREAMACGTPVIAMTAREDDEVGRIVKDGVTGHVLHRPRPEALLRLVQAMRDEPQRRSAMGMAAVLRARTFFTWDRAAERFAAVYTDARLLSRVRQDGRSLTLIRSTPRAATLTAVPSPGGFVPLLPA